MKLTFSVSPRCLTSQKQEIEEVIKHLLPDAAIEADEVGGTLTVLTGAVAAPDALADSICYQLQAIGVEARFLPQPPPVMMAPPKKRATVSLSTFIISLVAAVLVVAITTFSFTVLLGGALFRSNRTLGTESASGEDYGGKIARIDAIFKKYSLYDTNGDLLLDEMLRAYAAATGDVYAAYYTAEEFEELIAANNASLVGIGVSIVENTALRAIEIIDIYENSPAHLAGLAVGDLITHLGSGDARVSVEERGYAQAVKDLRGEEGSTAEFTVLRDGVEIPFSVVRAKITSVSVKGMVSLTDPTVGILRISGFDLSTPAQFTKEMDRLIGAGCTGFVFDVRNNPGGDLKSVNAVLSYFLNKNDLIMSVSEKDGTTTYYHANPIKYTDSYEGCSVTEQDLGKYRSYRYTVLTNGHTASAAELFTSVLSEYELADVVGLNTYGKGLIQSVFDLSQFGYSGGIKLTVGYYSPPSGVNYDGIGIAPDVEVALDPSVANKNLYTLTEAEDNQLQAAIANLK